MSVGDLSYTPAAWAFERALESFKISSAIQNEKKLKLNGKKFTLNLNWAKNHFYEE